MKRIILALAALLLLGVALTGSAVRSWSGPDIRGPREARNPWSCQPLNNAEGTFRFAIVSDRTGGHRKEVFAKAVRTINLMQPEFVLSVGDLIEGYTEKTDRIEAEWKEFNGFIDQLQMPFFYVPGNHDVTNPVMTKIWREKFGRDYAWFCYKNVLFLLVNSNDPPPGKSGTFISQTQIDYFAQVLAENQNVRWTIVCLHKPLWTYGDADQIGWTAFEKLLLDRPYTVFNGHEHHFQKWVRHGRNYYQLATTGGGSKLRGIRYGEFDQIAWVTMRPEGGPVVANLLLNGVVTDDLAPIEPVGAEPGTSLGALQRPTHPARGVVLRNGKPVPYAEVAFHWVVPAEMQVLTKGRKLIRAGDAVTDAQGQFVLSTYTNEDGSPTGTFRVTVQPARRLPGERGWQPPTLPARYGNPEQSGLSVEVKEGVNEFRLELSDDTAGPG